MPKSKKRIKKTANRNSAPRRKKSAANSAANQPLARLQPPRPAAAPAKSADLLEAQRLAAAEPGNRDAWQKLASLCMKDGHYSEAAEAFKRMTELAPDEPGLFNDLATALAMVQRMPEARRAQAQAVRIAPHNIKYKANLAKIMIMQEDFFGAHDLIKELMPQAEGKRAEELRSLLEMCDNVINEVSSLDSAPAPSEAPAVAVPPRPDPFASRRAVEPTNDPLNILFVQEAPCIRNYKTATALRSKGHKVTLAYTKALLSQMYKGLSDDVYTACIKLADDRQLWDLSARYDIVHCHNEPDVLTVASLAGAAPVIHDTHDLISLRANGDPSLTFFEGMANRGAHGRVYTTPYQKEVAADLYAVDGPSLVFYNYTSAGDLPKRMLPKLSARDGQTHIVYEGGIGGNGHRDFISLFVNLSQNGVHVHIYPVHFDPAMAQAFQQIANIHYHEPVSPKEVMEQMTQYDMGIIPFNIVKGNKKFLDSTIANKLFEYLAAGLPVFASPLQSYLDYFSENPVGKVFHDAGEILDSLDEMRRIAQATDLQAYARTYEGEVDRLDRFYRQVIAQYRRDHEATDYIPVLQRQKETTAAGSWA